MRSAPLRPSRPNFAAPTPPRSAAFHFDDGDDGDEDEDEEDEAQEAAQLDAFDFSTRSPVPMLHLLRQADVDAGEEQWFSQGGLPIQERNAAYLRGIGYEQAAALRAAALAESSPST